MDEKKKKEKPIRRFIKSILYPNIKVDTFTKVWFKRNMILAWVAVYLCILLAFLDLPIPENLACAIILNVIGVFCGYLVKAFFETKEEERIKFERERLEKNQSPFDNIDNTSGEG